MTVMDTCKARSVSELAHHDSTAGHAPGSPARDQQGDPTPVAAAPHVGGRGGIWRGLLTVGLTAW